MANIFTDVRAGDLITAAQMNEVQARVEDLVERVGRLEKTSANVIITNLSGSQEVRSELIVDGANFEVPPVLNTVLLDGQRMLDFTPGCTDRQLRFTIPDSFTGLPKSVTLSITNTRFGTATTSFTLNPEQQVPTGRLMMTPNFTGIGSIVAGNTYTYDFIVTSETTIAETYEFSAVYQNVTGGASQTDWANGTSILRGGNPAASPQTLQPFLPVTISVRVAVPAAAGGATPGSGTFFLRAKSQHNDQQLSKSSGATEVKVGSAPEVSDKRVTMTLQPFGGLSKGKLTNVSGVDTIELPFQPSGGPAIPVAVTFRGALDQPTSLTGTYTFEVTMEPAAGSDWDVSTASPSGPQQVIKPNMQPFTSTITCKVASNTAHTEARMVVAKMRRTDADAPFTSFIKMPIRGY